MTIFGYSKANKTTVSTYEEETPVLGSKSVVWIIQFVKDYQTFTLKFQITKRLFYDVI